MTLTTITPTDTRLLAGLEVTTTRATLTSALATVAVAIHKRPPVPVLAGVHLSGDDNGTLTLTGFDYTTAITVTLPEVVTNPGRCVLAHTELSKLLTATAKGTTPKNAATAPVTLAHNGNNPTLTVDGYTLPITEMYLDDYPTPHTAPAPTLAVDTAVLASEVARVTPAAGAADDLPFLANVQMRTNTDSTLRMTATDRYRLAQATIPGAPTPEADLGRVARVDAALLRKLVKHLKGDTTTVGVHDDKVMLASGPVQVVTLASEDDFPNVETVIPDSVPVSVTVDRAAVASAIAKAANILSAKDERGLSVAITVCPGAATVAPNLEGVVAPQIAAETEGVDEDGVAVHFNPKFLTAAVEAFRGEDTVTLHVDSPTTPVTLTGGGHRIMSAPYLHLVQPIRLH
ncbi:hypothetical protein [Nocardiopsis sp. LOL_012]|uniref:DNA polymerase III subunit beta family protein n=1 Tax=Nocardiopsis sp. LOL_012 TaxID=3345409 RepID=UPI003A8A35E2